MLVGNPVSLMWVATPVEEHMKDTENYRVIRDPVLIIKSKLIIPTG